jgi:carbon catabolite-derepressing protein kinase
MTSAFDDEDLALSISSNPRRGSNKPAEPPQSNAGMGEVKPSPGTIARQEQARTAQRLGQYRIEKTLGEGSFGKVKLAVHSTSGQKVALKIINRRKLITRDMAGRIEREIQYLQLLRHPHIIKL